MSAVLNGAVFPGTQGGPLEHVIAAKAVAFGEILQPTWLPYCTQVRKNAQVMAAEFMARGYKIISGGTDNHLMLIDLRGKTEAHGKAVENALVKADITVNKNMVPFDSRTPFTTSGFRVGTAAVTTRGFLEADCLQTVAWIDHVIMHINDEAEIAKVKAEINAYMQRFPLYT